MWPQHNLAGHRLETHGVNNVEEASVSNALLIHSEHVVLLCLYTTLLFITLVIIYGITFYIYRDIYHIYMNVRYVSLIRHL